MFIKKEKEDKQDVLKRVAEANDLLLLKGHLEDECAVGVWIYRDVKGLEQTARFTIGEVRGKRVELGLEETGEKE